MTYTDKSALKFLWIKWSEAQTKADEYKNAYDQLRKAQDYIYTLEQRQLSRRRKSKK